MSQDNKKSALRKTLLERRDGLSYDMMMVCEKQIRGHLNKIPSYFESSTIGCYYATGSEVPTRQIILDARARGHRVCLPRVTGDVIEFAVVDGPADLVTGKSGILEPTLRCKPADPDIVLVPTVGVSLDGSRLGRGGGHYDRFLDSYNKISVGLAFTVQVVRNIPVQSWDRSVSWIITEDGATKS